MLVTHRPTLAPPTTITTTTQRLSLTILSILLLSAGPALAKSTPPPLPASGDVLIAGGVGNDGNVTTKAEFYSVSFGQFVATGALTTARASHQAEILLPSEESDGLTGDIFVIGGFI